MSTRTILITIGSAILLLVLGVWVYLMLYGTPEDTGEVLENLGFEPGNQGTTIVPPVTTTNSPGIDSLVDTTGGGQALRQLTTRPVAGFIDITTGSSTDAVRYVERGTGHIYEIDLATGIESKLTITTIPQITEAVFSPSGQTVALTNEQNYQRLTYVGTINDTQSLALTDLEPNAADITFIDDQMIQYTVSDSSGSIGYRQNLVALTRNSVFSFAYRNLNTLWGEVGVDPIIITKPSPTLRGFMYRISGESVTPVWESVNGLTGFRNSAWFLLTYLTDGRYNSSAYNENTDQTISLPILTLEEKCATDSYNYNFIWCGAPTQTPSSSYVDDWYKGTTQSPDYLWLVNLQTATAQLVSNPERVLGRPIDVYGLQTSAAGDNLFFLNKTDYTLWQYDLLAQ